MMLQYFGAEKDIFSFNRNPKTFIFATLILMVLLRLMALLFEHAGKVMRFLPWNTTFKTKKHAGIELGQG
jgi:hypothetical protein